METIEIKDVNGVVLFVHIAENNSIEIAIEEAVKKNVDLFWANLTNTKLKDANLENANLKGAFLHWADLIGANLEGANLEGADLYRANLEGANLEGANLHWADLIGANLEGTNLEGADLYRANLESANLEGANLEGADLTGANFEGANLEGAYLKGANLNCVNFEGANLEGANLEGANLESTYFFDADLKNAKFKDANFRWSSLDGAKNIPYIPLSCPSEGAFVAWKKVDGKYLVKIHIPEDAKRLSGTTRKCRCNKAMVLDITSLDGETHFDEVVNNNYKKTIYKVGEIVYPDSFDEDRWSECSHGIHFFVDKKDAIEY